MAKETKKTAKKSALGVLLDKNTKEINKKLAISMAFCSIAMLALVLMSTVWPVFNFGVTLHIIIVVMGSICTLSPLLLYFLKVPDLFLKIYILVALQVLVTLLGTQNAIGIYITFMLVPIASCAYLSVRFTRYVTIFSYFFMSLSLYFNTANRYEVVTGELTHIICFRNYLIGFTIEYIIVFLFLEVILRKAKAITIDQQKLVTDLESERKSYELLMQGTNDIMYKYSYETDIFNASDLIVGRNPAEKQPIEIPKFSESNILPDKIYSLISEFAFGKTNMTDMVVELQPEASEKRNAADGLDSFYFEMEGRVIYDTNGMADSYVGLIRDVSIRMREDKQREIDKQTDKLTGMFYYDYMKHYIGRLPECYHEGMMLSITVLNFDKIVETYGFIYGDVLLKKIKQILFKRAERPEFCCRLTGAHFLFFKPSLEYVDGYQLQQEILAELSEIYVGEKEPNSLKCDVTYGQVNTVNMDEFTHVNKLDYKKSITQKRTSSLFDRLRIDERGFSREERERMAECQMFTNSVSDLLRGAKDGESTVKTLFFMMADFYGFDRVQVIQGKLDIGQANTVQEWTSKPEYELGDYIGSFTAPEIEDIKRMYEANGYIAVYEDTKESHMASLPNDTIKALHERVSTNVLLGAQLWIPTTQSEGVYTGAWQFDRCDSKHYSAIEIFWISELVSTITNYVRRMRADLANQAKTSFLSVLSHEVRTPMNAIIGLSEISLREEMAPELKCNIEAIYSAGTGLLGVVNEVLDYVKLESGEMEIAENPYDTLCLVSDIEATMHCMCKEGVELKVSMDSSIPRTFKGDAARIKQIVTSIGSNALKYTESGYVHIGVGYEKSGDDITSLVAVIEDTGRGMAPDEVKKIFSPYEQDDLLMLHYKDGTGLGLTICKQLCDLMMGSMIIDTELGKGATFKIKIPQTVLDEAPAGELEEYKKKCNCSHEIDFTAPEAHILVVDDTPMNITVFKGLVEPINMQIDTADDGKMAVDMAANKDYDIIFIDYMMPEMDGAEAAAIIREQEGDTKHTPIISLSANATDASKSLFANSGMDSFIPKPIQMNELLGTLKKYLPPEKIIKQINGVDAPKEEIKFEKFSFNYWKGVEWCGSPEALDDLLGDYYALIDTKADLIEDCYDLGHVQNFVIEVHSLKSTSRMIGAEGMSKRFETLEMLASNGEYEMVDKMLAPTMEMYRGAKDVLKNYAKVKKRKTLAVSNVGKKDALELLIGAMEEFDTDKVDAMMKSISQYDFTDEQLKLVEKLEAYVSDLDSDKTISTAKEIIEML